MFNLNNTVMPKRKKNIIKGFVLDVGNPQMTLVVFENDLDGTMVQPHSILTSDVDNFNVGEEMRVRTSMYEKRG